MSKPLGNEDAHAQVGTNGGLSQRWRADAAKAITGDEVVTFSICADELDAAKLRIEEGIEALWQRCHDALPDDREDATQAYRVALKIIREIL